MIVNVTTLGSGAGGSGASVGNIVRYLEGNQLNAGQLEREGSGASQLLVGSPGGYYADSGVGRWLGEGVNGAGFGLEGAVDRVAFERLLLGQDPNTGVQLMHSNGSARRSTNSGERERTLIGADGSPGHSAEGALHPKQGALPGIEDESLRQEGALSFVDLAEQADVAPTYLRSLARRTEKELAAQSKAARAGLPIPELSGTHLHASKEGRVWTVEPGEAARFLASRKPPQLVHGYDITFSVPKSVSVLWAASDPATQRVIEDGLAKSVDTAMAYLEDEGFWTRAGRGENRADGLTAAVYTHQTSRALEPQLHSHVVVANMAWTQDRKVQAVDARGLYAHATPAGHLADAAMRKHLSRHLGVEWTAVENGSAEIVGVPREAMRVMSSRRAAVVDLAEEVGAFSTHGRQIAALVTRPSKAQGVNEQDLKAGWVKTLADTGLDMERVRCVAPGPEHIRPPLVHESWMQRLGRGSGPLGDSELVELFAYMSGPEGVTKYTSVFDRRDVIAFTADTIGARVDANEIIVTADKWLATSAVPLEITNTWDTVGKAGSGRVSISRDQVYSTPEIVELEQRVIAAHTKGLNAGLGQVEPGVTEKAIGRLESKLGSELGPDQAAAVRAITTSGHRFQAVEGLAGAGKTTAMRAAVDAWQEGGYRVVGAAPFGTAAQKLGDEIGIDTRTVASLLQNMDHNGPTAVLDSGTVLLVDEASTISNRQLDSLYWAVEQAGATMRTVGDPLQHSAVEASGLWKQLVATNGDSTPVMDVNRRQNPVTMGAVRAGLETWRTGDRDAAMLALEADGRFATADTWPHVMDRLTEAWLPHHTKAIENGETPLQMISERNRDRVELNARAQAMLAERGLIGEGVQIGGTGFHINDRVVAQISDQGLKADRSAARDHVLNGSTGVVRGFAGPESAPNLIVDFDRLGIIEVPHSFVADEVGVGRGGGLAPAYAVTSYKAEGQTYEAALALAAPGAIDKEGMYVALTRGKEDLMVFSIDPNNTLERSEAEFAAPADPRTMTQALRDSLNRVDRPELASSADPGIAAALVANSPHMPNLNAGVDAVPSAGVGAGAGLGVSADVAVDVTDRSLRLGEHQVVAKAVAEPNQLMVAAVGERPERVGGHQQVWDQAVSAAALYEHRYGFQDWKMAGIPAQPTAPFGEQILDYRLLCESVENARHAAVAVTPLKDLLAERQLGPGDHSRVESGLNRELSTASNELASAEGAQLRATQQIEGQRKPSVVSLAALDTATERVDIASSRHRDAVGAVADFGVEGKPQGMRANLIDSGIDWRINEAVERPARYLVDAIGARPAAGTERSDWNDVARIIETRRHFVGLEPTSGPQLGDTPLGRALGSGPDLAQVVAQITRTIELQTHMRSLERDTGMDLGMGI